MHDRTLPKQAEHGVQIRSPQRLEIRLSQFSRWSPAFLALAALAAAALRHAPASGETAPVEQPAAEPDPALAAV